eukprot:scaffold43614_cov88-Phaeocystis_antarctica.AAC.3
MSWHRFMTGLGAVYITKYDENYGADHTKPTTYGTDHTEPTTYWSRPHGADRPRPPAARNF